MGKYREVSVRDLRNDTAAVVRAVEAGETLTLTVNRRPVADISPHASRPRKSADQIVREIREAHGPDPKFYEDIADLREARVDEQ